VAYVGDLAIGVICYLSTHRHLASGVSVRRSSPGRCGGHVVEFRIGCVRSRPESRWPPQRSAGESSV